MAMDNRKAFTLVELLTSLVIIALLVGILLPSIAAVRRIAKQTAQKAQFASIDIALEAFKQDYGDYPDSNAWDTTTGLPYCGAMKLAEAMVGQDLKGFNPKSIFRQDGYDASGTVDFYPLKDQPTPADYAANINSRRMYLQLETASPHQICDIYTDSHRTKPTPPNFQQGDLVLCDVYKRTMATGKKTGMPILYYKADTSKTMHDYISRNNSTYNSDDNRGIVDILIPWDSSAIFVHPMAFGGYTLRGTDPNSQIFYDETRDERVSTWDRPHNASTYILMSAGADNEYGTSDDIFNGF
jgi:prepilin-type N-terminal cleavage/methylation domain-containing protein